MQRNRRPEIMDQPDLDEQQHARALEGLATLNVLSRSGRILWAELRSLARRQGTPLRVLDVASGGGDVPLDLAQRAQRQGVRLQIDGCDVSPFAVRFAQQRTAQRTDVQFFEHDVLRDPLPGGYDAVTCSLFLHHLSEAEAVRLLSALAGAGRLVLVNDLCRSRTGYVLVWSACRLLTRSRVVHVDGPRSVEAAFTPAELRTLAERSGLSGATVSRRWPQRMLLKWERP